MDKIVLSLFDKSGKMVKPWAENGYECYAIDIATEEDKTKEIGDGEINYISANIHNYLPPRREYEFVFAFPPCTDLAVSGARHFKDKGLNGLSSAIKNVEKARQICEWTEASYMIENPASTLSTYWREPDYTFDPYEYDGYTEEDNKYQKKTCLWTSKDFQLPDPLASDEWDERIHQEMWGDSEARSVTPQGFANAVFEYNGPLEEYTVDTVYDY